MSYGNHTSATYIINLMEPDERDRTGHRFDPYDDTMESIASKVRLSATLGLMSMSK